MRRSILPVLGLTAGAASFAACRDATVAPDALPAGPIAISAPAFTAADLSASTSGYTFPVTIDPARENRYSDGINAIRIPAGVICDPATSSYGPAVWDAPCATATAPITLPVTVRLVGGRMAVEFGRDLRFVPSDDPARQVTLVATVPAVATTAEPLGRYAILWLPGAQAKGVDEGAADPALVTRVDRAGGRLVRRLKHFSGYLVNLGLVEQCEAEPCEGTVQPQ